MVPATSLVSPLPEASARFSGQPEVGPRESRSLGDDLATSIGGVPHRGPSPLWGRPGGYGSSYPPLWASLPRHLCAALSGGQGRERRFRREWLTGLWEGPKKGQGWPLWASTAR